MSSKSIITPRTELKVEGILGFMKKKVTKFGTGAKVDCPKPVHRFIQLLC